MVDSGLLQNLAWMVFGAACFGVVARLIRMPSILAYLAAGLVLGPLSGVIRLSPTISEISEIGIVLLLFLVGLELSMERIREVGRPAVVGGLVQVVLTMGATFGICRLLGFATVEAVFLGFAMAISSTVVIVKVLTDLDEMDSLHGRIGIGFSLVQDLIVVVGLTLLAGFSKGQGVDAGSVGQGLAFAFGGMAVLLGGVLAVSRWLLPRPFAWASSNPATLFIWSLGWCFLVVAAAHAFHLSVELGAFIAGLSLAQLPYTHDLQHRIKPLMSLFVAVFFVTLGVKMVPAGLGDAWLPALALLPVVLVGKTLVTLLAVKRLGYGLRTSFLSGLTMSQISEFSFVFVAMGAAAGLVGERVVAVTALVGVVTIAASSYLILAGDRLFRLLSRWGWLRKVAGGREDEPPREVLSGHVIVVGMNTLGRRIAEALYRRGETVLAIDTDPRKLRGLPCRRLHGNIEYRAVLEEQGLARAKLVVSALQIEDTNDLLAYRCQEAGVPCCIHAVDLSVMENLLANDVAYFMLPKVDVVKYQSALLREQGLLGEEAG